MSHFDQLTEQQKNEVERQLQIVSRGAADILSLIHI